MSTGTIAAASKSPMAFRAARTPGTVENRRPSREVWLKSSSLPQSDEPMSMTEKERQAKQASREIVSRLSLRKKLVFVLLINISLFAAGELITRVAYFAYDRSPYWLFYGVESFMADIDPQGHSVAMEGYVKFPPNRVLHQYGMFSEPTPIRINSAGLRGLDFQPQKPEGAVRVVSLGGSSTFGFYDRDGYTYPRLLEKAFETRLPERPVEVINAGVPHAKIRHLRAMLEGEVVDYEADFVTVYAGYNDAIEVIGAGVAQRAAKWLHEHVLMVQAIKRVLNEIGAPRMPTTRWAMHAFQAGPEYVERQIALHVERFDRDLRAIVETATMHRIRLVFIKQGVTLPVREEAESGTPLTYAERTSAVLAYLKAGESLTAEETLLAIHWHQNQVLESIASDHAILLVDNSSILDRSADFYASYVHITESGNRVLADAIFRVLRPEIEHH